MAVARFHEGTGRAGHVEDSAYQIDPDVLEDNSE